ncbi:MAG: discoidin domain-containing protein [Vicinamibacterales bacterium]
MLTALMGREVLANLSTAVANDAGDPLLTAAILHWNAHHIPWTEAWWQLPIFYPTRDTLAFSEHLLGLSAMAAPIDWVTGNALVTYNLITLLTFPLSGAAMYLLVYRLTRSAPGALIAGLAFGFAPFRISQLPHIQMLAAFWAPLALLGLHAFLESRKARWLVLYGAAWTLQSMANGYALVFFSVLIGFWVLWFAVAQRRWRDLGLIAVATLVAAIPLVPILYTYVAVHDRHGFVRGLDEIRTFSADVAAVLCAPPALTFWGWIRVACRAEGELFPGVGLFALSAAALIGVLGFRQAMAVPRSPRAVTFIRRLLLVGAGVNAAVILSVVVGGPWSMDWGWFHASAASIRKPTLSTLAGLFGALILAPGAWAAVKRASPNGFYLFAALVAWLLALGPTITLMGEPTGFTGPFAWLLALPGAEGLRVPARFWLVSAISLSVAAGLFVADALARRSRAVMATALILIGSVVAADGWATIGVQPVPPSAPDPTVLEGQVVMELPVATYRDIAAQWRAITGGWTAVNGYSGFGPSYYLALVNAGRFEEDTSFIPFQRDHELHVIVPRDELRMIALVERQPGVVKTAENTWALQYRLPKRSSAAFVEPGPAVPIARTESGCNAGAIGLAFDRDETTRWVCPPIGVSQELTIDLGEATTIGAFVQGMGNFWWEAPRALTIDTSLDTQTWQEAWKGSVLAQVIEGGMRDPRSLRIIVPFQSREARYLRVRIQEADPGFYWTIAEAEVRRPAP